MHGIYWEMDFKFLVVYFGIGLHILYMVYFISVYFKWIQHSDRILQIMFYLNVAIQYCICFYLLYRFHPYHQTHQLMKYDDVFIFWSAWIMAINLGILQIVEKLPVIHDLLDKYTQIMSPPSTSMF